MAVCNSPQSSTFPPLFNIWMEELLGGPVPEESRATCSNCAMLPQEGEHPSPADKRIFFNPNAKCCTYLPGLPNFLVGRIFRDSTPEMAAGIASTEQRLAKRIGVSPLGLGQPSSYLLWYNHVEAGFGRSETLRCPHYIEDGGRCSIWRHREATCSTWFCKHDRGIAGQRFWRDAVHPLLQAIEGALSYWCVMHLDLGPAALERLLNLSESYNTIEEGELDGKLRPEVYRALWGNWAGREREFFEDCAALVERLRWPEIEKICGPKTLLLARLAQDFYAQLSRSTPEPALRCGSFRLISLRNDVASLSTYSDYDPVEIPARLLGLLQYFDGQPTSEAIAAVAAKEKVTLTPELIRKLTDFGLLVRPEARPEAGDSLQPASAPAAPSAPPIPSNRSGMRS